MALRSSALRLRQRGPFDLAFGFTATGERGIGASSCSDRRVRASVGRSPHEAFFTPDGREVWVVVRGENYVSVLDGATYQEKRRIVMANGPGTTMFSPDGKYG